MTGGTGAGKSTVARLLAGQGAVVVDADVLAREVVAAGSDGLAAVVAEFGADVLRPDGGLDRAALAAVAFASDDRRRALEQITHPRIAARTRQLLDAAPPDAVVVHDVPLLVEKGMGAGYHLVVVVDAAVPARVARLAARGMAEADARSRIRAQATHEQRLAAADVWLANDGTDGELAVAVERLWLDRLVPFEQNVRLRTPVTAPGALVPSGPERARLVGRLLARLRRAAGERAHEVRQVVPPTGDPAQVPELAVDVRSDADVRALATPLADAGFPRGPGPLDSPADGPGGPPGSPPGGTVARHASADPGCPARVLVRDRPR